MQDTEHDEAFSRLLKQRRVHFDVDPEWSIQRGHRTPSGFEVRFFAAHEKGARALPGCVKSRALSNTLRTAARSMLPPFVAPTRYEFEPFSPVLYESRTVPGVDEVAVTVRFFTERAASADASDDPSLKQLRRHLKRLGVPEH